MDESRKICCFTGHRELKVMSFSQLGPLLVAVIKKLYAEQDVRVFISGAARGFDTYAAAAVCALRDDLPGLELWLAVPYRGHHKSWSDKDKEYFERTSTLADRVVVLGERYDRSVYARRNRWMVNQSQVCVAYYEHRPGGTGQTIAFAAEKGIQVHNLPELEVR